MSAYTGIDASPPIEDLHMTFKMLGINIWPVQETCRKNHTTDSNHALKVCLYSIIVNVHLWLSLMMLYPLLICKLGTYIKVMCIARL